MPVSKVDRWSTLRSCEVDGSCERFFSDNVFIFNNYKTQGTYLSTVVDVPDDLMRVILMYVKVHPESKKLKNKKYNIKFAL